MANLVESPLRSVIGSATDAFFRALILYDLIRAEMPETILVSVSHRATVEQFHARRLDLIGDGEWRLDHLAPKS